MLQALLALAVCWLLCRGPSSSTRVRVSPPEFLRIVAELPPPTIVAEHWQPWARTYVYTVGASGMHVSTESTCALELPASAIRAAATSVVWHPWHTA